MTLRFLRLYTLVVQYFISTIAVGVVPKLEQTLVSFEVNLNFLWALNDEEKAIPNCLRCDLELLLELQGIKLLLIKCED